MQKSNILYSKFNKIFFWYSLFVVFPAIVIFQNISVYFFIYILISTYNLGFLKIKLSKGLQKLIILFSFGAIISTLGGCFFNSNNYSYRSLIVLPNYLYWSFIVIFLIQFRDFINLITVFRAVTIGLLLSIVYYFLFKNLSFGKAFVFIQFSQNNFAFLLICFSPIVVYYVYKKYGKILALITILFLALAGFLSDSRSGSILVLVGTFFTYFTVGKIKVKKMIVLFLSATLLLLIIQVGFIKSIIYTLNHRTYELIYNTEETFDTDRSYLIRRALVDKGLDLFYKNPLIGVGLNNFSTTEGLIKGDFEGAEYVVNKDISIGKSAHNSYVSILAEGGLLLFIPFFMLLVSIVLYFIRNFFTMPSFYRPVFIGVIMMSVHLYFISAIVNVFAWFLLGIAAALMYRNRKRKIYLVKK